MNKTQKTIVILGASSKVWQLTAPFWNAGNQHRTICCGRTMGKGIDLTYPHLTSLGPVDAVVSFLGVTQVTAKNSWQNAALARQTCEISTALNATQTIFASSGAVYGTDTIPHRETSLNRSLTLYGKSKWQAEEAITREPCNPWILRLANVAGADRLFSAFRDETLTLEVFENGNTACRSYLSPHDLALALHAIVDHHVEASPRTLNIAGPSPVLMSEIAAAAGRRPKLGPSRSNSVAHHELDVSLARSLGIELCHSADPKHLAAFSKTQLSSYAA